MANAQQASKRHIFTSMEDAQAAVEALKAKYPKTRMVYRVKSEGADDLFVVAQTAGRARGHYAAFIGLNVELADKPTRAPRTPKTIEEQAQKMSPDEIKRVRDLLDKMLAGQTAETPAPEDTSSATPTPEPEAAPAETGPAPVPTKSNRKRH